MRKPAAGPPGPFLALALRMQDRAEELRRAAREGRAPPAHQPVESFAAELLDLLQHA
jgi:hypothetical protein